MKDAKEPQKAGTRDVMSDQSLYRKIVENFRRCLSSMSELHTEFRELDDLYLAKHWNKERASWRPDPVVNYVAYIVDQKLPQLINAKPTGLILPTTSEDDEAAKLLTEVTDVVSERVGLDDKIEEVAKSGLHFGTGFFKVYWDNKKSGGSYNKGNLWLGDICIDSPDVTNMYVDPQANDIQDARYVIYAGPRTTQWVEEIFNEKLDAENAFETEILDRASINHSKDMVMYYEYWYKEKGGVHCVYAAGGKILKTIPNVYKHGKYPFIPFTPKKSRKSVWGIPEAKNIIANQKLLNKMVELPVTNALMTANPIALVAYTSGIDTNKWTNTPGKIWQVKDINEAVKWLEPPRISSDVPQLTANLIEYIERIGGVYDAATGNTPGSVTAATAIQLLQEQASQPVKAITRNLHSTIKEVYEQMIELIKEFYTEERYIRITDDEGNFDFKQFRGSDFAEIDFDIKVSGGASTPTSKAYIAQLSSDLFDRGILLPSEFVDMQENLPNKDRIVARLREQEQAQQAPPPQKQTPPQEMPAEQVMQDPNMLAPPMEQPPMDLQTIYESAPPEIQQQIQLMAEQGMTEDQIIQTLLQMGGQ